MSHGELAVLDQLLLAALVLSALIGFRWAPIALGAAAVVVARFL